MSVKIVEGPGYYPDGKGGIVLHGEWGRPVTIKCVECGTTKDFRLCADEILPDAMCDCYMDEHLASLGWGHTPDICPSCMEEL